MKKTNGRSRTNPHKREVIGTMPKKQHQKEENNIVNNHHIIMAWCTTKYDACLHVRFKYAWHGKVHKQHYKLSGAQYASGCILTKHHIPLFSSLSFMYSTILNVVKHGKRVKQMKTTYLGKFKWGRNNKQQVRKNPHVHILGLVLVCPKQNFRVVKHAKQVHHVKLGKILPHLHIKFIKFGVMVI